MVDRPVRAYLGWVAFSLAGSGITRALRLDPGLIAPVAAAFTLLFACAAAFAPLARALGSRAYLALGSLLLLGTIAEVVGVSTGWVFGAYDYTDRWQPTVGLPNGERFPLLVPLAWFLMAGCGYLVARRLGVHRYAPAVGGLIAATIDLGMEPVMVGPLGYWKWTESGPLPGGAPIQNFIGWFVTATLGGAILHRFGPKGIEREDAPAWVLLGHVVLVLGLAWVGLG